MGFEVDKVPVPLNGYYQKKKKKSPLPFQEAGMSSQLRNLPITKRFQRYMYKTTPFSELICSTASHGVKLALHFWGIFEKKFGTNTLNCSGCQHATARPHSQHCKSRSFTSFALFKRLCFPL